MSFDEFLRSRRIRRESVSRDEVHRALELADRDLQVAEGLLDEDRRDWGFAIGYNAVLQASRAYMFSQGYRPASAESHKNTLAFMRIALGQEHRTLVTYFDRMRRKRHQAVYDQVGLISEREARDLLARACEFVALVRELLAEAVDE